MATDMRAVPVVLILLAGCLGAEDDAGGPDRPDGPDGPDGPGDAPARLEWGLTGCAALIVIVPADAAALAPHLPDGFTPVPLEQLLGAPVAVSDASLGIEALSCASGQGLAGTIEDMAYGSVFAPVTPPAASADANVTYHFVKWDVLIPDDDRRAVLAEAGVPALPGGTTYTYVNSGGAPSMQATLDLGGNEYVLASSSPLPQEPAGSFIEFTPVEDGLVTWHASYTWATVGGGPATVTVPAGTLAAAIVGAGAHSGAAFVGQVDFHDAWIDL